MEKPSNSRDAQGQNLTLRRTPRSAQGYIESKLHVVKAIPLHMVLIPRGSFTMGSPDDEIERARDESPQHEVSIQPFFMGRYPVTQAQWRAVVQLPQVKRKLDPAPSNFPGENRPVEQVSWYEAEEFCTRLAAHTGRPYRFPTEAEWEYACRAGTKTPFYFGKTLTDEIANFLAPEVYADVGIGLVIDVPRGQSYEQTTDVDFFGIANAFGLSDMHGNVKEWCQDQWHRTYDGAPTDGSAWLSVGQTGLRILRGGSWDGDLRYCRSASRTFDKSGYRGHNIGFRVSCAAPRALS